MNRVFLLLFSFLLMYSAFAQEEVWGYQSFGGEIGGGLVFKLDLENDSAETVHRFDFTTGYKGFASGKPLVNGGNGLLYGIANVRSIYQNTGSTTSLFSFNPENNKIDLLSEVSYSSRIIFMDSVSGMIYFWNDYSNNSTISSYNLLTNEFENLKTIDSSYGLDISGDWIKIDGKYYFFMQYAGEYNNGTLLEYDPIENQISKVFDFDEIKNPQGSLLKHDNGHYYGVAKRGGESNKGSIFKLDPKGGGYEVLVEFNDETGSPPSGNITLANDGCIYGFTRVLGEYGKGCIYRFNPYNNKLEAVYYFNPETPFMDNHLRDYQLIYDNNNKMYFSTAPYEGTANEDKGFLLSFNIESLLVEVEIDYSNTSASYPSSKISILNDKIYGFANNEDANGLASVFFVDHIENQIQFEDPIYNIDSPQNGYNPVWMCQGIDGKVYGINIFGGEEDKGVVFSIDPLTNQLTKMMDLKELGFEFNIRQESFLLENGLILGFLYDKSNDEESKFKAFEFNTLTNSIDTVFTFPISGAHYDMRMNSSKNVYFVRAGNLYEYEPYEKSFSKVVLPDSIGIRNIYEQEDGLYFGSSGDSLFRWNRNNSSFRYLKGIKSFGDSDGAGAFRNDIYVSKQNVIYGDYIDSEEKPAWIGSFAYDYDKDSILGIPKLWRYFYDNSHYAYLELEKSKEMISMPFAREDYNRIINLETNEYRNFSIETSPYYVDYFYEWGGIEIDGGNYPFGMTPCVGLTIVNPKENKAFWTGVEDSIWYNKNNWYRSKLPVEDEKTIISGSATYFPFVDTLIEIADLEIQKKAEVNISPFGALSCDLFENRGALKMYSNEENKASFISAESNELGNIHYYFQADKQEEKLLALPIQEMKIQDFDSTQIYQYHQNNWQEITDTNTLLINQEIYKFKLDTTKLLEFSGDAVFEDAILDFSETGLQPIPNSYVASLNWDELNLSNLSHKAHYRFNEEDSTFSPYIDGLGGGHPLVQPLDVVWVKAEQNELVEFKNSDLMHAINYKAENHSDKQELVIAASFGDKKDLTYIRFNTQATTGFDHNYDATKLFFSDLIRPMVFTWAGEEKVSINQLPDTTMLDMSVLAPSRGNYKISLEENLNFDFVVLEDLILHTKTDLLQENYTFEYFPSDGNYPFKLYFKDWVLEPLEEDDIQMYFYLDKLVISSIKQVSEADITFFDLAGRLVFEFQEQDFFQIEKVVDIPAGHYIVQVRTGEVVKSLKIFVR